jgi:hypothetical protein
MMQRSADDLLRIVVAGGGFTANGADYSVDQLIRIANAARGTGIRIHLLGMAARTTEDLVKIALASGGAITFEL